jgi:hypothetical protein
LNGLCAPCCLPLHAAGALSTSAKAAAAVQQAAPDLAVQLMEAVYFFDDDKPATSMSSFSAGMGEVIVMWGGAGPGALGAAAAKADDAWMQVRAVSGRGRWASTFVPGRWAPAPGLIKAPACLRHSQLLIAPGQ